MNENILLPLVIVVGALLGLVLGFMLRHASNYMFGENIFLIKRIRAYLRRTVCLIGLFMLLWGVIIGGFKGVFFFFTQFFVLGFVLLSYIERRIVAPKEFLTKSFYSI